MPQMVAPRELPPWMRAQQQAQNGHAAPEVPETIPLSVLLDDAIKPEAIKPESIKPEDTKDDEVSLLVQIEGFTILRL